MRVTFDPAKRANRLWRSGFDFDDAALVFEGITVELEIRVETMASVASSAMSCSPGA